MMFWSDIVAEEIYQANLDGSGMTEFVNTSLEWVGAYHLYNSIIYLNGHINLIYPWHSKKYSTSILKVYN